ncbi:MAG: DNA primase DnaG [Candidatus Bathyarchaeota archaeon]|nr:DNA primase DnaG [Candidatus Bathyarchaeota archaeon]MDH5532065.1 DNA primase DnaG [Candidatus Bathyarchaeota archaeon]MDH5713033.1 DNA primase DnaG [Candidatus Bathyarchaeota archaeon]
MGSSQTVTVKYVIRAKFEVEGVVEKPDVIGAVFGQTEGLFGSELDLRELQKSGRIGRIEIELKSEKDKTIGKISIPTSLDRVSTSIIAASLESINRVGPCSAVVTLEKVEDVRDARRRAIIDRAKKILQEWTIETLPSTEEIFREVSEILRAVKVEKYGPEGLPAGPNIEGTKEIILVEGRADVINLSRNGIDNVIAVDGAKIPETIIKLCREKEVTALLDGDRGGDLILKELLQVADIKYVARAPRGKEVEELSFKQISTALHKRVPIGKIKGKRFRKRQKILVPKQVVETAKGLEGTLEAVLFNEKMKQIEKLPVSGLAERLQQTEGVDTVVFDGVITQRLVDIANEKNVQYIVAARVSEAIKQPLRMRLLTFADITD